MNRRFLTVLFALIAIGIGAAGWTYGARIAVTEPLPSLLGQPTLLAGPGTPVRSLDLAMDYLDFDTLRKVVILTRFERGSTSVAYLSQEQVLSTSYFVVAARAQCDLDDVYVAGVFEDGTNVVERWRFTENAANAGVALPVRPLPTVMRTVLYQGTELGHIQSIEPDPEGRFVLLLTLEGTTIYRISLPDGSPEVVWTPAQIPELAGSKNLSLEQAVGLGRVLIADIYRAHTHFLVDAGASKILLFSDPENDGTFLAPHAFTLAEWTNSPYNAASAYTSFCP